MLNRTYQCVTAADRTVKQVKVLSAERLGGRCRYVRLSGTLSSAETRAGTHLAGVTSCAFPRKCFCKHFRNHLLFFAFWIKTLLHKQQNWKSSHLNQTDGPPGEHFLHCLLTAQRLCDKCQICKETGRQLRFGVFLLFTEFSKSKKENKLPNQSKQNVLWVIIPISTFHTGSTYLIRLLGCAGLLLGHFYAVALVF